VIAVMVVLYAPLAISYMWYLFTPDAPRLQTQLTEVINGKAYATGTYSVHWARDTDYAAARWALLVHTTLGGVALALAMLQFSARIRARWIGFHRWLGRTYFVLMTISMVTAIIYLTGVMPIRFIGGAGFQMQLWLLAIGTLGSGFYALWAIRRRDVLTHRAWMTMNISFMLTAPLLRVFWVFLAPLRSEFALLMNLNLGSIALSVIAPAGGALAFMITQRSRRRGVAPAPRAARRSAALAAAVLGTLVLTGQFLQMGSSPSPAFPVEGLLLSTLSAWGLIAICLAGAARAAHAGDWLREGQWSTLLVGAALAPVGAALLALALLPLVDTANALIAGLMVGPAGPIGIAFAVVVHRAGRHGVRRAAAVSS
jgi:hypothetical protein